MLYNVNTPKADAVAISSFNACFAIQKTHNSIAQQLIRVQTLLIMDKDMHYQVISRDNL